MHKSPSQTGIPAPTAKTIRELLVDDEDGPLPTKTGDDVPVRDSYLRALPHIMKACRDFGYELSVMQVGNISALMRAVECVDRYLDEIHHEGDSHRFINAVVDFLSQTPVFRRSHPIFSNQNFQLPFEVIRVLTDLKSVLGSTNNAADSLVDTMQEMLLLSRRMRVMRDARAHIAAALHEGELAAWTMLHVLDAEEDPLPRPLVIFLLRAGGVAHVYDNYLDMDSDFMDGKTQIPSSISYRTRLATTVALRGAELVFMHPNKSHAFDLAFEFLKRDKKAPLVLPSSSPDVSSPDSD